MERQSQRPKGPHEDHAPGPGYFGVGLRADAREVTECRSLPLKTSARPDDAIRVEVLEVVVRGRGGPHDATTFRLGGAGLPNCRCVVLWCRQDDVFRLVGGFPCEDTAADGR